MSAFISKSTWTSWILNWEQDGKG